MQFRHSLICAALLAAVVVPSANAATWDIDGKHSSATFKVKHMMISTVSGQMTGISGTVDFDGRNIDDIKVNAQLDPATINTGDAGRDGHLKNADFFDVAKYPTITFQSTGVLPIQGGGFKLGGKLTMHGVTKNVELAVDGPTPPIKDTKGKTRVGAAATTTVHRKDFGIVYNSTLETGGVAIGDDVQVTIEVELVKREDAGASTTSPADAAKTEAKEEKKEAKEAKKEAKEKKKESKEKKSKDKQKDSK